MTRNLMTVNLAVGAPSRADGSFGAWLRPCASSVLVACWLRAGARRARASDVEKGGKR